MDEVTSEAQYAQIPLPNNYTTVQVFTKKDERKGNHDHVLSNTSNSLQIMVPFYMFS